MSGDKHDIEQQLKRYLSGEMTAGERHAFERQALDDPFLQEALDGAEGIGSAEFVSDVNALQEQVLKQKSNWLGWKVAAAVLLLLMGGWSVWWLNQEEENALIAFNQGEEKDEKVIPQPEEVIVAIPEPEPVKEDEKPAVVRRSKPAESVASTPEPVQETNAGAGQQADAFETVANYSFDEVAEEEIPAKADKPVAEEPQKRMAKERESSTYKAKMNATGAVSRAMASPQITGRVTDEDGESLPGVNVVIKGTTSGVTTDLDGFFAIDGGSDLVLVFSSVGMTSQEVEVGDRKVIDVEMALDTKALSEVVVTGYGVEQKEELGFTSARPIGGFNAFKDYLEEELRYPEEANNNGVEGSVLLELSINETGAITNIEVKRSLDYGCDEEAIRLVKNGPPWQPAKHDGASVASKVRVRVRFQLD